jgi:hypothetical protein
MIIADYNGVREVGPESNKPDEETYLKISVVNADIQVDFKDDFREGFLIMIQQLFAGNLNELIAKNLGEYGALLEIEFPVILPDQVLVPGE